MKQQGTVPLQIKKFIPGIAWFFVVLILMCTPGKEIPKVDWLENIDFDKVVHIGVFGLLTVLFCWPFYKTDFSASKKIRYFFIVALLTSAFGYGMELVQKYCIEGRTYDLIDWIADSIGAVAGFFFSKKKFA